VDERRQLNWVVRQDENRSDSLEIPMTAVGPNAQPLYSATEAVTLPPEAVATGSSTARETLCPFFDLGLELLGELREVLSS